MKIKPAISPATILCRTHHRQAFSIAETGRAWIGTPSLNRWSSSANAAQVSKSAAIKIPYGVDLFECDMEIATNVPYPFDESILAACKKKDRAIEWNGSQEFADGSFQVRQFSKMERIEIIFSLEIRTVIDLAPLAKPICQ